MFSVLRNTALATAALGMALLSLSAANADVILTYTGNDFNFFEPPLGSTGQQYTATDMVTATITLANPLGDSFSGSVTPLNVSLSDGVQMLTLNSGPFSTETFDFTTNATGTITNWNVELRNANGGILTANEPAMGPGGTPIINDEGLIGNIFGQRSNDPASWSEQSAAVPEPPTASVLGAGLLGLAFLWWRRRRNLDLAQ